MTTDNRNGSSTMSEIAPPPRSGPIGALPNDLILEIFSYLEQQDCLRCMAVCRDWYSVVPGYTQAVWKKVRLNINWIAERNLRHELCLGRHVKGLVIEPPEGEYQTEYIVEEKELHALIQSSLAWGCTEVESIELINCVTTQLYAFLDLIKLQLPHVKQLSMTNHVSRIEVMDVLYYFPRLTQFACRRVNSPRNRRTSLKRPLNIPDDYCTKLTHLWLDSKIPKREKELILQKCPDLVCYIDTIRGIELAFSAVELDQLFTWCPKITFLETNAFDHHQEPDAYLRDQAGLRYLNVCDGYEQDQLSRQMIRNQNTLEFVCISHYEFDALMAPLQLRNLRTLICFHAHLSANALASLPDRCPGLETFSLHSASRLRLDWTFVQSLPIMHRLKSLSMQGVALDDDLSLLTLLERFPILERLELRRMTLSVKLPDSFESPKYLKHLELPEALWYGSSGNIQDREAEIAHILRYLTYASKIESIRLPHVPMIGRKSLLMMTMIPTLKLLEVHLDYTLQEEELVEFIMMLRGTVIETLTLGYVCSLTFTILSALAELPYLKVLCTEGSGSSNSITQINKAGLQQILWASPKLTQVSFVDDIMLEDSKNVLTRYQIRSLVNQLMPDTNEYHPQLRNWRVRIDDTPSVRRVIFTSIPAPF